jgi:Xaa-Pro aminopeptidase
MKNLTLGFVLLLAVAPLRAQGPMVAEVRDTTSRSVLPGSIAASEFTARRQKLAAKLPDGVFLALGAGEPRVDYLAFFQIPVFRYLTGVLEPEAALVMHVKDGQDAGSTLFVQRRDPSREVWSGKRMGPEGAAERYATPARPRDELDATLDSLIAAGHALQVVGDLGVDPSKATEHDQYLARLRARHEGLSVTSATGKVAELRAYKSPAELELIKRATELTVEAHREVATVVVPNGHEYQVQAMAEYVFRRGGAERPSFATIVGTGENSTVLHYNTNDAPLKPGDMVVVDIGASVEGYAADMTRSYPVNGTFSPAQREIYQIVRDAQAAAEREAVNGAPARRMNEAASASMARGLAKLGLIDSVGATYDCGEDGKRQCSQLSLFYLHGLGHGIGLEVHDPDRYYYEQKLGPGSVFTIEPGVYVRENLGDLLPATERNAPLIGRLRSLLKTYANIGVRIEDDYLVTESGLQWLTRSPREIPEIEAAMAARKGRSTM